MPSTSPPLPQERTLPAVQDPVQGGARAGTPQKPGRNPPPPYIISTSARDGVILPAVDSLTAVMFYLPFSRSLCLDFGQTTNNAPHGNPSICGMCGLALPVPSPRKAQFILPGGPALHPRQLFCVPSMLAQGPVATCLLSNILMSLSGVLPACRQGADF